MIVPELFLLEAPNAVAWATTSPGTMPCISHWQKTLGFPCITADNALLLKMKGHSIVIHLKDVGFES